jgi:hypothetical protein
VKNLTLIIENVRTFRGRHEIPIRPLTILTGENSSGKTTLLAMFSVVCEQQSYPLRPDFNRSPYNLGNYETIASLDPTGDGWAPHFSLGFRRSDSDSERIKHAEARYVSERGQIRLNNFTARGVNFEFRVATKGGAADSLHGSATIRIDAKTLKVPFSNLRTDPAPLHLSNLVTNAVTQSLARRLDESFDVFLDLSLDLLHLAPAAETSLAPIRSEPQRVYSQITEVFKPTGDHIPFVLARLLEENGKSHEGKSLSQMLTEFGVESGLFHGVTVNRFGGRASAPFELRVGLDTTTVNLADVGYGVSQVLPLLVEASTAPRGRYLSLQQPEVHLHPRAQAALGTLFAQLAAENHCRLMVETHSDYLMDRVRQEVAAGKIAPEKVALLYLHREGLETKCHLIEMDRLANLINPPDDYRSFFLEETRRLLGRGAKR